MRRAFFKQGKASCGVGRQYTGSAGKITNCRIGVFATRPALAVAMVRRALAAAVPFAWVAADTVYEVGELEMALRRAA